MSVWDDLSFSDTGGGDLARENIAEPALATETPAQTVGRLNKESITQGRQELRAQQQNDRLQRMTGAEFARRGVPSYPDASGMTQPVTDETGAALTKLDRSNSIAWDSLGKPRAIKQPAPFAPSGTAPTLADPYEGAPQTTDKAGNTYKAPKGLPWQWSGTNPDVVAQNAQDTRDNDVAAAAQAIGGKLSLDQHDAVTAASDYKTATKHFKTLADSIGLSPDAGPGQQIAGALDNEDPVTAHAALDQHFDTLYAQPSANQTKGLFSSDLSPSASEYRANLDQQKLAGHQLIDQLALSKARLDDAQQRADASRQAAQELQTQRANTALNAAGMPSLSAPAIPGAPAHPLAQPAADAQSLNSGQPPATAQPVASPIDQAQKAINDAKAGQKPYSIDDSGAIQFKDGTRASGIQQAALDGILPPDTADKLLPVAQKADAQFADLVKTAGDNPKLKAFISAGLKSGLSMEAGAALSSGVGAVSDPWLAGVGGAITSESGGWGAVALPLLVHGITFLAGQYGSDKALKAIQAKLADYSDTVKSLKASEQIEPGAASVGSLLGAGPRAAMSVANLAKLGATEAEGVAGRAVANGVDKATATAQGQQAAAKLLGTRVGLGAAVGAAFETVLRPAFDATLNAAANVAGISHEELQSPTVKSILTSAALGAVLTGEGIKMKGSDTAKVADIFQRAADAKQQGKPLESVLSASEIDVLNEVGPKLAKIVQDSDGQPLIKDPSAFRITVKQALLAPDRPLGDEHLQKAYAAQEAGWNPIERTVVESVRRGDDFAKVAESIGKTPEEVQKIYGKATTLPGVTGAISSTIEGLEPNRSTGKFGGPEEAQPPQPAQPIVSTPPTQRQEQATEAPSNVTDIQKAVMAGQMSHSAATDKLLMMGMHPDDVVRAIGSATSSPAAAAPEPSVAGKAAGEPPSTEATGSAPTPENTVEPPVSRAEGQPPEVEEQIAQAQRDVTDSDALQKKAASEGNGMGVALHGKDLADAKNRLAVLQAKSESSQPEAIAPERKAAADAPESGALAIPGLSEVDEAAHTAATSPSNRLPTPSDAQKEAGNYKKGKVSIGGMDISIENPAGSKRRPEWPALKSHYGYIRGTIGKDGDHIDAFIKPGTPEDYSGPVFVVNQNKPDGSFDEHKAVIGVNTPEEAKALYASNYETAPSIHSIATFNDVASFKDWAQGASRRLAPTKGDSTISTTPQPVESAAPATHAENPEPVTKENASADQVAGQEVARSTPEHGSGNQAVDDGGSRHPIEHPNHAARSLLKIARGRSEELDRLLATVAPGDNSDAAMWTNTGDASVQFDKDTLFKHIEILQGRGIDVRDYMDSLISHELIHRRQLLISGQDFRKKYTALWGDTPFPLREKVEDALRLTKNTAAFNENGKVIPSVAGAELERMAIEQREYGRTSEEVMGLNIGTLKDINSLKGLLASEGSNHIENSIAEVSTLIVQKHEPVAATPDTAAKAVPEPTSEPTSERGPPARPRLGETVGEVIDNWKSAQAGPREVVVGKDVAGGKEFQWSPDGKLQKLVKKGGMNGTVDATPDDELEMRGDIARGGFQIERQQVRGMDTNIWKGVGAGDTRKVLHQATGSPLSIVAPEQDTKPVVESEGAKVNSGQPPSEPDAKRLRQLSLIASKRALNTKEQGEMDRITGKNANTPSEPLFSQLTRTVQALPQETMTVGQARAAITKGAKPAEIAQQGILDDPLSPMAGKADNDKVSKADLVGYSLGRQAKVSDVTLGGGNLTHFSQYQLPGADEGSYREQFVTWPKGGDESYRRSLGEPYSAVPGNSGYEVRTKEGKRFGVYTGKSPEDAIARARSSGPTDWARQETPEPEDWKDGHSQFSDIANPIVRIRRNIRTDSDGKKTFFLEEMQGPGKGEQEKMPPELRKRIYEIGMKKAVYEAASIGSDMRELTKPYAIRELSDQLFGSGQRASVPALSVMDASVIPLLHHEQIRRAVIANLPVNVVNDLRGEKISPDSLLSNGAVEFKRLPANLFVPVSRGVVSAFGEVGALLRAKLSMAANMRRDVELLPALKAGDLTLREAFGILSSSALFHGGFDSIPERSASAGMRAESLGQLAGANSEGAPANIASLLASHIVPTSHGAETSGRAASGDTKGAPATFADFIKWHGEVSHGKSGDSSRFDSTQPMDAIGWTTGETQADRYDLSKHVKSVYAAQNLDGTYRIEAKAKDGSVFFEDDYPPGKLPDVVGKELAEKIVGQVALYPAQGQRHSMLYSGLELKVGGEGLKNLYDVMLPRIANKLAEKVGGKVGTVQIRTKEGNQKDYVIRPALTAEGGFNVRDANNTDLRSFQTRPQAEAWIEKRQMGEQQPIHSMPIPKAWKDEAPSFALYAGSPPTDDGKPKEAAPESSAEGAPSESQPPKGESVVPSDEPTENPEDGKTLGERLVRQAEAHGITYSMDTLKGLVRGDAKAIEKMRAIIKAKGLDPLNAGSPPEDDNLEGVHHSQFQPRDSSGTFKPGAPVRLFRTAYDKAAEMMASAKDEIKSGEAKDLVTARYDAANNLANYRGAQAGNSIRLDIPEAKDREAMPFVIEAGGNRGELRKFKAQVGASSDPKLAKEFVPIVQHAIDDFERLDSMHAGHDKMMMEHHTKLTDAGIDVAQAQNYVTRKLDDPENIDAALPHPLFEMGDGGSDPRYFMKGRSFKTLAEAIQAGYPTKSTDIADLDAHRIEAGEKLMEQNRYIERLKATPAPTDGKPIIGEMETRTPLSGKEEQVVPKGYSTVSVMGRPLVIHDQFADTFRNLFGSSSVRSHIAGRALLKAAALAKGYTLVFDTFHVGRMLYKMAAGGGGAPITTEGGKPAWNIKDGLSLLEYSDADLDRAVEQGMIPKGSADYARKNRPLVEDLMASGLNVGKVSDNLVEQAGVHLPIVAGLNDWIFSKLSRGAMLQTAIKAFERNEKSGMSRPKALRQTAKEMNEYFGNLQNQGLFTNKTLQDVARLVFLAPNWTESQARYEGRAYAQGAKAGYRFAKSGGKERYLGNSARALAVGFVGLLAVNQLLNYMSRRKSTFQNPEEGHKLDAWLPGGKRGFWLDPAEIAAEYFHAAEKYFAQHENPVDIASHIASNKLSPIARGTKEALTGLDFSGRHFLSNADRARASIADALPSPLPLGMFLEKDPRQPLGYRLTRQPGAVEKQILQSGGAKVTAAQSPRTQMFAIAQQFRADRGQTDAAGEYTELRKALDNDDRSGVRSEVQWLQQRGKGMDQIEHAVGWTKAGEIKPEQFAGSADREAEMLRKLTPPQRAVYDQAQRDHRENSMKFRQFMQGMPRQMAGAGAGSSIWDRL